MQNHYRTLGLSSSATPDEIRRAYRILARRYHPDLNPGANTDDKFKVIAEAYHVLSDAERKKQFDIELEVVERSSGRSYSHTARARREAGIRKEFERQKFKEFGQRAQEPDAGPTRPQPQPAPSTKDVPSSRARPYSNLLRKAAQWWRQAGTTPRAQPNPRGPSRISIIEVSISVRDAILGMKKTVEIEEPTGARKISVSIPQGVRNGSVVRLRARNNPQEEIVLIVRVASHPYISVQPKGLVIEVPVSVQEALLGASVSVPSLDEPITIRVPAGTQSGTEVRVKDRGIRYRDGSQGDLFYRIMIRVPAAPEAVGLKDKAQALEQYYGGSVRIGFPSNLLDQ